MKSRLDKYELFMILYMIAYFGAAIFLIIKYK